MHECSCESPPSYNVWGFSHTEQYSNITWVPYKITQFLHCLPRDGVRSHGLRAQFYQADPASFRRPSQAYVVTCASDLLAIDWQFPLLGWLTKLRETFYLLDHQLIVTGLNSGRARRERCVGPGVGGDAGSRCSVPVCHTPPNLDVLTNPQKLPKPCLLRLFRGFITQA